VAEVDGLNAGYARALLDEYLENPEAVPSEWRALFESGESELLAQHPGVVRLLELMRAAENGENAPVVEAAPAVPAPPQAAPAPTADETLVGGVAAAMALVKAYRTMATWRRASTHSAPSPSATQRSSRSASSHH
jgi:2-oxoglutarate dehydrogenase complex dehydrogenase (E1) component-like enzyme